MKKIILGLSILMMTCTVARADVFGTRNNVNENSLRSSFVASESVSNETILENVGKLVGYLGVREGAMYDLRTDEFLNYAVATLYTYDPAGITLDVGMLNTNGAAASVSWNIGAIIPAEDVPVAQYIKYLYIGFGVGGVLENDSWDVVYGPEASFKFVF